jgi:phosphocarrier protein
MQVPKSGPAMKSVVIKNEYGLHLRPADLFARTAIQFVSEITVRHNDRSVNGKSILDLATLAAECGSVLDIEAIGPDADTALAALARLVESDFQAEIPKAS